MTKHEAILWKQLRKSPSGFDFVKQFPIGKYITDFVNRKTKLIIELDGSGHGEESQIYHDAVRDKFLQNEGYRIIRFWNESVIKNMDGVLDRIYYYLTHENEIPPLQNFYPKEIITPLCGVAATPPASGVRRDSLVIEDCYISDFISYLRPGDVVVFNNSKVIPARFDATASDGTVYEITLHTANIGGRVSPLCGNAAEGGLWWALSKRFQKLKPGEILMLGDGTKIEILDKSDESGLLLKFHCDNVFDVLDKVGKMPLPPYMKREEEATDKERYQTVYANPLGSMAAPTAGLHFTPALLDAIREAGAEIVNITLHVGAGTWAPVKSDDTADHKMHSEWGVITSEQADTINRAKAKGSRVIAVGTTSLRLLESAAEKPFCGTTDIFITPGYKFKVVDVLLTNFHLPKSTLFMLVSAFAGLPEMKAAYAHAVAQNYRFFSYGDCCLLFKKENS